MRVSKSWPAKRTKLIYQEVLKMNYNQNKKIAQITTHALIIGVDIAKFKHVARAQDFRDIEFGSPCYFENTQEGIHDFLQWISQLKSDQAMEKVIVGMEPRGHY